MITFKQYLEEASKYPEYAPIREVTMAELIKILSKSQINSLKKNKAVQALSGMDQTYKYGVDRAGFVELEIEAGYAENGVPKPTRLLQIKMDPRKVIGVERFYKGKEGGWKHLG